jgi:hypothetical protein
MLVPYLAQIRDMEKDADEGVASWSEIALRNIRLRRDKVKKSAQ